ncbi:MAG: hypothetical protein KGR26_04855, partial [Cyanobacteria bacterium REEB65]|nr:hypothetical protein [Cyanobacteria bacterium REEB65]
RLQELLTQAIAAPFWRQRLQAAGYSNTAAKADPHGILRNLSPLTRDELLGHAPPRSDAMLTGPLQSAYVFRTGGTSGEPKFSVFSTAEFRAMIHPFVQTYRAAGLEPTDRVANVFAVGSLYASFVFVNRCLEELGVVNLPYTMAAPVELVASQWEGFGLDTVMGFPSHLMRLVPAVGPGKIRKLFYAGEHLHAEDRRVLTQRYGIDHIASGGYGAVDTGLMALQCRAANGSEHHVLTAHTLLEIVHPESFEPVAPGEVGMVLVTCLDRYLMPILRYDIGDLACWLVDPCPCGLAEPRLELLGRGGDALRIGIANVAHGEIASALADVASFIQLVKERDGGKDVLRVRYELRSRTAPLFDLSDLQQRIRQAKPDLAKMLDAGQIAPIVVEQVSSGSLPRSPLTGKQLKVEDRSIAH